ncbi:unnamed protein product [Durusdinium trenchii]|uniref:rRNA adenine N(6)-methyltransferase n=1 Tax=Durusdinium trenchii TaxID=1381693 RepID=A0ABP0MDJ3_9DINO
MTSSWQVGAHELFSVCFWELGTATKESSLGQLGTFFRATAMPKVKKQNLKKKAAKGKADSRKPAGATGTSSGGLVTNKKFGQHLLRNPGIVDKILNAAELKPSDVAFEIGPGTGGMRDAREKRELQAGHRLRDRSPHGRGGAQALQRHGAHQPRGARE